LAGAQILVAGSIGPTGQLLKPLGPLDEAEALAIFAAQAESLAAAGVDLLVIETQFDLGEARAAIRGARSVSALPLVVSFSYDRGTRTMMGVRPSTMAAELVDLGVDVLGINCGRSLEDNLKALKELRSATTLPVWFKPNAGLPVLDEDANPTYTVTPEQMGVEAANWVAAGANIVGGCCGTSPAHLAAIARAVKGK
jgi:5-methyltetrahydrofolate--homocysteine methyltransferase